MEGVMFVGRRGGQKAQTQPAAPPSILWPWLRTCEVRSTVVAARGCGHCTVLHTI
ncbi:hypothetical protein BU23DRAFT_126896 [Bimuria novae-zelandiae CBS 107.79]|uniref:Uncharacterized protein n=1 Tax=Bimuria novae-zelandiae CBS 107.79 TaxID=1447943 RepID=A0A6A5VB69_9PLEO|nr:hypothetical protein BU23DRAFT_126896 [Bimuria novae-zelandiae CBS 107.79]